MERVQFYLPERAAQLLHRVQTSNPLVQSVTNQVTTNFVANTLLAVGGTPAMVDVEGEAGAFAKVASGVLINLGTPAPDQRKAILEAVQGANHHGTPWVLDPVAVGTLAVRTELARDLLPQRPAVIRGNPSEIRALAGVGTGGRGVDASDQAEDALDAAQQLTELTGGVVAISGPTDIVTDGTTTIRVTTGHPLLTRITGGGCALGAVVTAFLGVDRTDQPDSAGDKNTDLIATVAACAVYTIAAQLAAEGCAGPGSFQVAFHDVLAALTPDDVVRLGRFS